MKPDSLKLPWFWGKTGHDGYCLAQLTFASPESLRTDPFRELLHEYQELQHRPEPWMKGDRFFLAHGVLERLETGPVSCTSQIAIDGPVLRFSHNLGPCSQGLHETQLMLRLARELPLTGWHFEVGCRSVDTWAEGQDGDSLIRHLKALQ